MLEVLAHLVTHRERVVPKGELLDELWDGVAGVGVGADADHVAGLLTFPFVGEARAAWRFASLRRGTDSARLPPSP